MSQLFIFPFDHINYQLLDKGSSVDSPVFLAIRCGEWRERLTVSELSVSIFPGYSIVIAVAGTLQTLGGHKLVETCGHRKGHRFRGRIVITCYNKLVCKPHLTITREVPPMGVPQNGWLFLEKSYPRPPF